MNLETQYDDRPPLTYSADVERIANMLTIEEAVDERLSGPAVAEAHNVASYHGKALKDVLIDVLEVVPHAVEVNQAGRDDLSFISMDPLA